jgi:hypothetical protein
MTIFVRLISSPLGARPASHGGGVSVTLGTVRPSFAFRIDKQR